MVFVFLQLTERPRPLQQSAKVSNMALRSSHATKAMSLAYVFKFSDDCLKLKLLPVTHELGIMEAVAMSLNQIIMEVGHSHTYTLHLMVFQGHANGQINVEIEEGGSKHTTLPDTTGDFQ